MQNTPPVQPPTKPPSSPSQQASTPAKQRAKKRVRKMQAIGSIIGPIAALLAIFQFTFGIQNLPGLFKHPTPTPTVAPSPTPLPTIASPYYAQSPGCLQSSNNWKLAKATMKCLFLEGTQLFWSNDPVGIGQFFFNAPKGYRLAPNEFVTVHFSGLTSNLPYYTCAGLEVRANGYAGYAFYICGNGHWYIVKYSSIGGSPLDLLDYESPSQQPEQASNSYTLAVTVYNSELQMTINGGAPHQYEDSEYTLSQAVVINVVPEISLFTENYAPSTSIIVSGFRYSSNV